MRPGVPLECEKAARQCGCPYKVICWGGVNCSMSAPCDQPAFRSARPYSILRHFPQGPRPHRHRLNYRYKAGLVKSTVIIKRGTGTDPADAESGVIILSETGVIRQEFEGGLADCTRHQGGSTDQPEHSSASWNESFAARSQRISSQWEHAHAFLAPFQTFSPSRSSARLTPFSLPMMPRRPKRAKGVLTASK